MNNCLVCGKEVKQGYIVVDIPNRKCYIVCKDCGKLTVKKQELDKKNE